MKLIFYFIKSVLQGLLLCWYPGGRDSRKQYRCFIVFVFCAAFGWSWAAHQLWAQGKEPFYLYGVLGWLVLALYMSAVRRGHDLGYSAGYTLQHYWRFSAYPLLLLKQEGQPYANEYGPAPQD